MRGPAASGTELVGAARGGGPGTQPQPVSTQLPGSVDSGSGGQLRSMGGGMAMVWPTSRFGRWAVGTAAASAAGLVLGTVVPERVGWSRIGLAGASAGLALGLAGGILAVIAIVFRGDRVIGVVAAFVPFAGSVYLIRRSLAGQVA